MTKRSDTKKLGFLRPEPAARVGADTTLWDAARAEYERAQAESERTQKLLDEADDRVMTMVTYPEICIAWQPSPASKAIDGAYRRDDTWAPCHPQTRQGFDNLHGATRHIRPGEYAEKLTAFEGWVAAKQAAEVAVGLADLDAAATAAGAAYWAAHDRLIGTPAPHAAAAAFKFAVVSATHRCSVDFLREGYWCALVANPNTDDNRAHLAVYLDLLRLSGQDAEARRLLAVAATYPDPEATESEAA